MFYVLGAFLPSLPGWCRNADLLIKTWPVIQVYLLKNVTNFVGLFLDNG